MKQYGFANKLRRQGNSLVVTIPAETAQLAGMKLGKTYQFKVEIENGGENGALC